MTELLPCQTQPITALAADLMNQIAALRQENEALCAASPSEWQPIESVPRNGTPFLLWVEGLRMIEIMTNWDGSYWRKGEAIPDNEYFTHWMPLPPPPNNHNREGA